MHTEPIPRLRLFDLLKSEPRPSTPTAMTLCLQQQQVLVTQGSIFAISTVFISTISAFVYSLNNPVWLVLAWYIPIVIYSVYQFITAQKARMRPAPTKTSGRLMRMAEYGCIFLGTMYGATYFLFFSGDTTANFFNMAIVSGFCASLTGLMSSYPRQVSRFITFAGVPMLLSMALIDLGWTQHAPTQNIYQWVFLLPTIAGLAGFFRCVLWNHERMVKSVIATEKSKSAEQLLRDALNAYNDAFAIFDENGKRLMSNRQHDEIIENSDKAALSGPQGEVKVDSHWFNRQKRTMSDGLTVLSHSDITDLKLREAELLIAQKEAVEADHAKSRFLSTMSHELRSPLNVILGFSRLMASDSKITLTVDEIAEYADSIHESGAHLLTIINDIIDYSKMGLNKLVIDSSLTDTRQLIAKSVKMAVSFEDLFELSNITVDVSRSIRLLNIDESVCQRILMGLITNAMRFSGSKSKVSIKIGMSDDKRVYFAVRDFGCGIAPEHLDRVFEAFYQVDTEFNRDHGGTGLGLTLCRHLAKLQGGDVVLKSRVGAGTTAIFVLPPAAYVAPKTEFESRENAKSAVA